MMPKFHGMRKCLDMYITILVLFESRMMLEILVTTIKMVSVNDLFYIQRLRKKAQVSLNTLWFSEVSRETQ
jgi:hypothetical protein